MALPNPRFEESYARIFGHGISMDDSADAFFQSFYDNFLEEPEVAVLFANTNIARQVVMLKKSLFQLVSYYVVGEPTAELDRLALVHRKQGISSDMFDIWMQALLDTAADFDAHYDEATALAWCWALAPGIAYMRLMLNRDVDMVVPDGSKASD
jgi:truncated hemoglobin YjbI